MDENTRQELYHLRKAVRFLARKIDQINNTYCKPDNTLDEIERVFSTRLATPGEDRENEPQPKRREGMKAKKNKTAKNWCSKHQRVHEERRHKSCRYPNDVISHKRGKG